MSSPRTIFQDELLPRLTFPPPPPLSLPTHLHSERNGSLDTGPAKCVPFAGEVGDFATPILGTFQLAPVTKEVGGLKNLKNAIGGSMAEDVGLGAGMAIGIWAHIVGDAGVRAGVRPGVTP